MRVWGLERRIDDRWVFVSYFYGKDVKLGYFWKNLERRERRSKKGKD